MGLKPNDQQYIYDDYWMPIEELTTEKESNKSKLSDFIRDYLTLKFREIPTKNKVYEDFKRRHAFDDTGSLEMILAEIKSTQVFITNLLIHKTKTTKR